MGNGHRHFVLAIGFALAVSVSLTLWAHAWICWGMNPESIYFADVAAPSLGVFAGAFYAGRHSRAHWRNGVGVALVFVALWFAEWSYTVARFDAFLWWRQAVLGLTWHHGVAWIGALLIGAAGGVLGSRLRDRNRRTEIVVLACPWLLLPVVMPLGVARRQAAEQYPDRAVPADLGMIMHSNPPRRDGTIVRLLSFDLTRAPHLNFGIYDADCDDAAPYDDRNTTWLGQTPELVFDKIQRGLRARRREVRCLINGGFFGAKGSRIAFHEAPLVINGKPLYNADVLQRDWPSQACIFGVSRHRGQVRFHLERSVPWSQLGKFKTALGGVRALRINGKSLKLEPGMGGTKLRCSRTSIGWTADSKRFYILSVRDPDGEAASQRQRKSGKVQTGGWDVREVQRFWERLEVPQAVLFDGGESTSLAYSNRQDDYLFVHSAYHVSWTFAYWRGRPLRIYWPMLPALNHGGVLNYLYIDGPRQ